MDRIIDENGNPIKSYPLPPHPADRRNDFENALMEGYAHKKALENGTEPPPRRYQSDFDRAFHEWCDRNWERWQGARSWSESGHYTSKGLWAFDKIHDGMYVVGEFFTGLFGLKQSRYQWVIDAAEAQAYQEQKEREEEEAELREIQEEEDRLAAAEAAALEGGLDGAEGLEEQVNASSEEAHEEPAEEAHTSSEAPKPSEEEPVVEALAPEGAVTEVVADDSAKAV